MFAELEVVVVLYQLGDVAVDRFERAVLAPVFLGQKSSPAARNKTAILGLIKMPVFVQLSAPPARKFVSSGRSPHEVRVGQGQLPSERFPDRGELVAVHQICSALAADCTFWPCSSRPVR